MEYILSSGITSDGIILENGSMTVLDGGIATDTTVNSRGFLYLSSGGTASSTTVNTSGSMFVSSGGTATDVVWTPCEGHVYVSEGGYATFVSQYSGVYYGSDNQLLSNAEIIDGMTVNSSCEMNVMNGGVANSTTVNTSGSMFVSNGGTANSTTVNFRGSLYVSSGGIATEIKENGGYVYIADGANAMFASNKISGLVLSGASATVHSGTTANSATVHLNGNLYVFSGGKANYTTVNSRGSMYVSSGGTANITTVRSSSFFYIFSGGIANSTTVRTNGYIHVYNDGRANSTMIDSCGYLQVSSGGVANITTVNFSGCLTVFSGGIANDTTVSSGGSMYVSSGGTANTTIVKAYGWLYASNGGVANNTLMDYGGEFHICGGVANSTSVIAHGSIFVSSGGTANSTTINTSVGHLYVFSGGVANITTLNSNGNLTVSSGGVANITTVNSWGSLFISSGGVANSTTMSHGAMFVSSGGIANITTVNANARMQIDSGGLANNTKVFAGGSVVISSGAVITGKMHFLAGAIVSVEEGAVINFDLTKGSAGNKALLSDWSLIQGTPDYTITVNAEQAAGIYKLAGSADEFDGTITVQNVLGESLGSLIIGESLMIGEDTYSLSIADEILVLSIAGSAIIPVAPEKPVVTADVTTPTNMDVLVTATFSEDSVMKQYSFDGENWGTYPGGVLVGTNLTVYFRGIDAAGNASEAASYEVTNVDRSAPVITLTGDNQTPATEALLTAETDDGSTLYYCVDDSGWTQYTQAITVTANGSYSFMATDAAGNTAISEILFANIRITAPVNLVGTADSLSWDDPTGADMYQVELSTDDFANALSWLTDSTAQDLYELPAGTYQWRVKEADGGDLAVGEEIRSENAPGAAKVARSNADGNDDIFFASANDTWSRIYYARHVGSVGEEWTGTGELVSASGKGRIQNLFFGSADPNILCLTDSENGDAIFLDDVYTELPEEIEANTARLLRINQIWAGAGDDIVDMTSQRFEYVGGGMVVYGGDGNDVIWANTGGNRLFGDAGDDRIVGASGDDVIVGGIGDDRMHGGGGEDTFVFCENWGADTVQQLETGSVTLWFASGDETKWNPDTLTYTDGDNTVTVKGVAAEQITLKFGDDGSERFAMLAKMEAFDDFASRKLFDATAASIAEA